MVEHARFLAGQGHATLRMDCLGIGDLDWLPEGPLAVIHHEERAADVSQAIDALEAIGFDDISAAGVCSGAFLAFRAALKDVRIKRLLLVNPQFWLPLSSEQLADARQGTFGSTSTYFGKALSVEAWRRVVAGQVDLGALLSILGEIAARGKKTLMSRFPKLSAPRTRLESELSALGERGCQTLLVLGAWIPRGKSSPNTWPWPISPAHPQDWTWRLSRTWITCSRRAAREGCSGVCWRGLSGGTNTSRPRREENRFSHRTEGVIAP